MKAGSSGLWGGEIWEFPIWGGGIWDRNAYWTASSSAKGATAGNTVSANEYLEVAIFPQHIILDPEGG